MRIIGQVGFESRNFELEGMIQLSGSQPTFVTTNLPSDSLSLVRMGAGGAALANSWMRYFHDGATVSSTPKSVTQTEWGFHFRFYQQATTVAFSTGNIIAVSDDTTEVLGISFTTGNLVTIRVNGVVVATSVIPLSVEEWERIHVFVDNQIGGEVEVYIDGDLSTPIVTYTLLAPLTNPNAFKVHKGTNTIGYLDDMFCWEMGAGPYPDNRNLLASGCVEAILLDGDGNYTEWGDGAGGTGSYTAIDEYPPNDTDFIDSDAVDERYTATNVGTANDLVYSVQVAQRVMRSGTLAGENMQVLHRVNGVDDYYPASPCAAPGDGHVIVVLDEDAEGNPWTKATLLATEFGAISRT